MTFHLVQLNNMKEFKGLLYTGLHGTCNRTKKIIKIVGSVF